MGTVNADPGLVIVNDGSMDNTASIVDEGMENRADYVFQTDSDGQTVTSEFDDFWNR